MERIRSSKLILFILSAHTFLFSLNGCEGENTISPNVGSVTLAWETPTTYADSKTCYNDPGGFKVYIAPSSAGYNDPGIFDNTIKVPIDSPELSCINTGLDSGTGCGNIIECTYTVENLMPGTWQVTLTTYNLMFVESDFSNFVTIAIQ